MVKKLLFVILIVALIGGAWFFMVGFGQNGSFTETAPETRETQEKTPEQESTVSLSYRTEQSFDPDKARLILGVETENENVETALSRNNEKMEGIMEGLGEYTNIELSTSNFRIIPQNKEQERDSNKELDADTVYKVINQIEIISGDPEGIGEIIEAAASLGANSIVSLDFLLGDQEQAKREVTSKALKGLEDKMQHIAEELGGEKVELESLKIDDSYVSPARGTGYKLESAQAPPISPGEIKISINLQADFQIYK